MSLAEQSCVSPRRGGAGIGADEISALGAQVPGWEIVDHGGMPHLQRAFAFDDFSSAISFAARIAAEADEQGPPPKAHRRMGIGAHRVVDTRDRRPAQKRLHHGREVRADIRDLTSVGQRGPDSVTTAAKSSSGILSRPGSAATSSPVIFTSSHRA